ncbi:MAG: hypothetical protein IT365_13770 [Candidatus Hydrogenedentes bacterium]|nr:hypothetical protein [Candidatus Hydrogenedentota bacterium]
MRALATAVAMGVVVMGCATVQDLPASADFATFRVSGLQCVIGNNAADGEHRSGYNGVFRITSPDERITPYVPLYAGLNLEHYFDARPRSPEASVFFEPRHAPMEFRKVNDTTAELHQPATPVYGVESWTTFELKEPHYIDMSYRCIPRKDAFQGGFMGVFWASYINAPHDKSIYFLQGDSTLEKPRWAQVCTQKHGVHSTIRWQGDAAELQYPPEADTLFNSLSPYRFSAPFYYGRVRDMVLIYIFKPNPYLRFAHSPSGGGNTQAEDDTNPAWDFQLVIPDWKIGETYTLTMRAVYKPWVDRADVLNEVAKYLNE